MGESFKKFKRRALLAAIFKCVAVGVFCGLFAAFAVLLSCKLLGVKLLVFVYPLIGVGAAAIFGALTFFLVRPTDDKLAAELDKRFHLREKVQTAVEFEGKSGPVIDLQRENAEETLSAQKPKFSFNFKKIWQYAVIGILAVAMVLTSVMVPAKTVEGAGSETPETVKKFQLTDAQIADVNLIIENVNASALKETLKESAAKSLKQLLGTLMGIDQQSDMEFTVSATLTKIDAQFAAEISYKQVANALALTGQSGLAQLVADGAQVYRDFPLDDYSNIENFYLEGTDLVQAELNESIETIFAAMQEKDEVTGGINVEVGTIPSDVVVAASSSGLAATDALIRTFYELGTGLLGWQSGGSSPQLKFQNSLSDALAAQAYVQAMNRYVCLNLADIFSVPAPADPEFKPTSAPSSGEDDDKKGTGGGYGDGSLQGGSDDMIYNPNTGEYEKYLDILAEYFAIVDELLRTGELTEEQIHVIRTYFDILFGGLQAA